MRIYRKYKKKMYTKKKKTKKLSKTEKTKQTKTRNLQKSTFALANQSAESASHNRIDN